MRPAACRVRLDDRGDRLEVRPAIGVASPLDAAGAFLAGLHHSFSDSARPNAPHYIYEADTMTDLASTWTPLAECELGLDEEGDETSALSTVWSIATCTEEEFRPRSYLDIQIRVLAQAILDIRERALQAVELAMDAHQRMGSERAVVPSGRESVAAIGR